MPLEWQEIMQIDFFFEFFDWIVGDWCGKRREKEEEEEKEANESFYNANNDWFVGIDQSNMIESSKLKWMSLSK